MVRHVSALENVFSLLPVDGLQSMLAIKIVPDSEVSAKDKKLCSKALEVWHCRGNQRRANNTPLGGAEIDLPGEQPPCYILPAGCACTPCTYSLLSIGRSYLMQTCDSVRGSSDLGSWLATM